MKVVSNSSPLIFLSKLEAIPLLNQCFKEVHIPQAVYQEIGEIALLETIKITPISALGHQYVNGALGAYIVEN